MNGVTERRSGDRGEAADWKSKRTLAEVFGDVLPGTTSDERAPGPRSDDDRHYYENRPPHHG